MPSRYNHKAIEKKWQRRWEREKLWEVTDKLSSRSFYVLDMFPYPSAEGLHVGHPEGYTASDIVARYKKMKGYTVLHPMGFDAFGLPAENYAIKTGTHPAVTTKKNITNMRQQIKSLGFAYDWSREVVTSDPEYYKWTQWIFVQLFKHGLAYEAEAPINWCPSCKTGLANEEVINGKCERCGSQVTKKQIKQWLVKITDQKYIERLLYDLDKLDWPESIKQLQRNWIGRSEGAEVDFVIARSEQSERRGNLEIAPACLALASSAGRSSSLTPPRNDRIKVFTTRPDTLFGATYMVLSPEHPLVARCLPQVANRQEVEQYIEKAKVKSDLERTDLAKEKTGVELKGITAINPVNNKEIPIWIADYVLSSYGTGAIMAVPAHDERDFEFAKKYQLPIIPVIKPDGIMPQTKLSGIASPAAFGHQQGDIESACWTGDGEMINSGKYNGLDSAEFKKKITAWLEKKGLGKKAVNYKLRDWLFSRQRYWGEPIPIIHCGKCGQVAVPEEDLPLELPEVENYRPTGTGQSPLAAITDWVNTKCPACGGPAKRETNTMPQWAGSNWYWLRYCDPNNDKELADKKKLKQWLPVDLYVGGAEHAVLHLLYARFIYKFLYDIGVVPKEVGDEPFTKLKNQGIILGEDGVKMSKSRGNVINPDEVVEKYGADTMRMYEMFMGPFEDSKPWDTKGIIGIKRFLDRVWSVVNEHIERDQQGLLKQEPSKAIYKAIKKVTEDIESFKFNTAISTMMEWFNDRDWGMKLNKQGKLEGESFDLEAIKKFLIVLSPFAPHLTEELWEQLGYKESIIKEKWPEYKPALIKEDEVTIVVQVNGKVRDNVVAPTEASEDEVKKLALASQKVQKHLKGDIKKIIFVKAKLINFVV